MPKDAGTERSNRFVNRHYPANFERSRGARCGAGASGCGRRVRGGQNFKLRLDHHQVPAPLVALNLAVEKDELSMLEYLLLFEVGSVKPSAANRAAAGGSLPLGRFGAGFRRFERKLALAVAREAGIGRRRRAPIARVHGGEVEKVKTLA